MSTNTTPSAGAVRVAKAIGNYIDEQDCRGFDWHYEDFIPIIDRETGAAKLADALESLFAVDMNCPCEVSNEVTAAWAEAESALIAWKEGK